MKQGSGVKLVENCVCKAQLDNVGETKTVACLSGEGQKDKLLELLSYFPHLPLKYETTKKSYNLYSENGMSNSKNVQASPKSSPLQQLCSHF